LSIKAIDFSLWVRPTNDGAHHQNFILGNRKQLAYNSGKVDNRGHDTRTQTPVVSQQTKGLQKNADIQHGIFQRQGVIEGHQNNSGSIEQGKHAGKVLQSGFFIIPGNRKRCKDTFA